MSIESDLKKEGIEVISKIDTLTVNSIAKNVARRIEETFPELHLRARDIFSRLAKLDMYRAKMREGIAEANYFYKNSSIYFNEHIEEEDLEEFAIHECLHHLQEIKDENNNLKRMGLCIYLSNKPTGLALNEAAVQYTASYIIGIKPSFERYYDITLYTPSPSYYPLECSLINEILYFTGNEVLFRSTIFSNDEFKNKIIELTSIETFNRLQDLFDKLLKYEEKAIFLNEKIMAKEEGSLDIYKLTQKTEKNKKKIANIYFDIQNIIINDFFEFEFERISNLEELEKFRKKLYKFSDIIGNIKGYDFFNNFYVEMMNKLEHKCNILENGGIETALSTPNSGKSFITLVHKLLNLVFKEKTVDD